MPVLVDSSVWIDYFRGGTHSDRLDYLIDENILAVNELILAELVPFLRMKRQRKLVDLLRAVNQLELDIDWDQIIEFQYRCLNHGVNGIGIPDLIIAQNALRHRCEIYSLDRHFKLIQKPLRLSLID
jgi:predicted nucleic acid-binding protein